jgi:hypothetical protein
MMRHLVFPIIALVLNTAFWGCEGGSATETTGGSKVIGRVYYPDGTPAVGANITVRHSEALQDSALADDTSSQVDAIVSHSGGFHLDSLQPGNYILEIRDTLGNVSSSEFEKGLGGKSDLPTITLRRAGAVHGQFGTIAGSPDRGWVYVYGLGRVVHADTNGIFSFKNLPAGQLRLKAISSKLHWSYADPLLALIMVGDTTTMPPFIPTPGSDEIYSTWLHSRSLVVNTKQVNIQTDVQDFPLLLRLNASNFDFTQSSGNDLRFAMPDGRHLAYAIEKWDSLGGSASIWIHFDLVKGNSSSQNFIMFWGNQSVTDRSDSGSVFNSFSGVWHLSDNPGSTPGVIADGRVFPGSQAIEVVGSPAMKPQKTVMVSAWVRVTGTDSLGSEILSMGESYGLRVNAKGAPLFFITTDSLPHINNQPSDEYWDLELGTSDLRDSLWHQIVATYDGVFMRLYLDGNPRVSTKKSNELAYLQGKYFCIGKHGNGSDGYGFVGSLDEIEVSSGLRTPEWISLAYQNQKLGSILVELK